VFGVALSLGVAALGLGACGGDSTGDGNPVSETEFAAQFPRAFCQAIAPCCADAGRPMNASVCPLLVGGLTTDMAAPGTTYDAGAAQQCLQVLAASRSCNQDTVDDESCNVVYVGSAPLGAVCTTDSECAPQAGGEVSCDFVDEVCIVTRRGASGDACSTTCEGTETGGYTCYGAGDSPGLADNTDVECWHDDGLYCSDTGCAALVAAGGDCSGGAECAPGLSCDFTSSTCTALAGIGDACSVGSCVDGAYCAGTGVCVAQQAAGQPCTLSDECLGFCNGGVCDDSGGLDDLGDALLLMFCGG
jgi:hypothetical protein